MRFSALVSIIVIATICNATETTTISPLFLPNSKYDIIWQSDTKTTSILPNMGGHNPGAPDNVVSTRSNYSLSIETLDDNQNDLIFYMNLDSVYISREDIMGLQVMDNETDLIGEQAKGRFGKEGGFEFISFDGYMDIEKQREGSFYLSNVLATLHSYDIVNLDSYSEGFAPRTFQEYYSEESSEKLLGKKTRKWLLSDTIPIEIENHMLPVPFFVIRTIYAQGTEDFILLKVVFLPLGAGDELEGLELTATGKGNATVLYDRNERFIKSIDSEYRFDLEMNLEGMPEPIKITKEAKLSFEANISKP